MPTALISGAGIAGPVLAWWLSRAGWSCTVIERDATPRLTGQQIDIRGAGVTIIRQMGLEDAIRAVTVKEQGLYLVDDQGGKCAAFPVGEGGNGGGFTAEFEILRGELAAVIMRAAEEAANVRMVYGDKIVGLKDTPDAVEVTFKSGAAWGGHKTQSFDVVVAADGMHSSTRTLMFPEYEKTPLYSLDAYITYFTIPLDMAVDSEMWGSWTNFPGGCFALVRPDVERNRTGAYLGVCSNSEAKHLFTNYYKLPLEDQKRGWKTIFAEAAKQNTLVARVVAGMDSKEAGDFYMQDLAQVKVPTWARGRMALLGDAAACPSPMTGMGTTVGIVGAYFLALELAKHPNDHVAGLRAYEDAMRPIVKKAQWLAPGVPQIANPQSRWGIAILRSILGFLSWTRILNWFEGGTAAATPVPAWPESQSGLPS